MRSSAVHLRNESSRVNAKLVNETKCVTIVLNGHDHFNGAKFVLNQKQTKSFSAFLNHLSEKLQPKFGAVRTIYDIHSGRKVLSLQELKHNQKYAAAGIEPLRRNEKWYQETVQNAPRKQFKPSNSSTLAPPSKAAYTAHLRKRGNSNKSSNEPITIYVYRNGEAKATPTKFLLTKQQLLFWDKVLTRVSQTVLPDITYIRNGFRLCALNGHVLNAVEDLSDGQTYVAVGNFETFRRRNYLPVECEQKTPNVKPAAKFGWASTRTVTDSSVAVDREASPFPPERDKEEDQYQYEDDNAFEEDDDEAVSDEGDRLQHDYSDEKFEDIAEDQEDVDQDEENGVQDEDDGVQDEENVAEDEEDGAQYEVEAVEEENEVDKAQTPREIFGQTITTDNEDEGFHSGPCSSNRDDSDRTNPAEPTTLPEFRKTTTVVEMPSPDLNDLESIRHSYLGFYDSPLPVYSSTSKAVVAVGSGFRRPSYYYSAATQTFGRPTLLNDNQDEIDEKLRLEADPNNVFHAKGENALTRHAPEIQETKDTQVDLPVDFWEAHEVLEEIPEDPPPDLQEDSNKNGNKYRSSTFAY